MRLIVLTSLLVLGLSAGDHKPGEGCSEDSQCIEGYKCLWHRELQYYGCAKDDKPTPVSSGNTPQETPKDEAPASDTESPSDETPEAPEAPQAPDLLKAFQDALVNFFSIIHK